MIIMTYFYIGYLTLVFSLLNNEVNAIKDPHFLHHDWQSQGEISDSEADTSDVTRSSLHDIRRYKRNSPHNIVDIERFVEHSTKKENIYNVTVDDTMTQLIVKVILSKGQPLLNIIRPSGTVMTNITNIQTIKHLSNGSSIVTITIPISQTHPKDNGQWSISNRNNNTAEVMIQGLSPVSIQHSTQFFKLGTNSAIKDNLLANKNYRMKIVVNGADKITNITGRLFPRNQRILQKMIPLSHVSNIGFENLNTTILDQPFYVGIEGIDKSGNMIKRLDPHVEEPIAYIIEVNPDSGAELYENSTLNITYIIHCYAHRTIKVHINDTMGLIQTPTTAVSYICNPGIKVTDIISLQTESKYGPTMLTIKISYKITGYYVDGLTVHKTYTVMPSIANSSEEEADQIQSDTPIASIVGGVAAALLRKKKQ